jgi:hypothetical protein
MQRHLGGAQAIDALDQFDPLDHHLLGALRRHGADIGRVDQS